MTITSETLPKTRSPRWMTVAAAGGIAWNSFGAVQFAGSLTATEASLTASGLTPEQAALMTGYPAWMTAAFAVGVFGGLAGSVLLLVRRAGAMPVLLVSLLAYASL